MLNACYISAGFDTGALPTSRLEREINRCTLRNPGITVLGNDLLNCVEIGKRISRTFENEQTSCRRLLDFLSGWDGSTVRVADPRDRLGISPAVWKDSVADTPVKEWCRTHQVHHCGRGINTMLYTAGTRCA